MQATTIKIENPLLNELKKIIPRDESLSSYVRKVLERDIQRRKMMQSAEAYAQFLESNPEEAQWLEEWASIDLTAKPRTGKKRKKS
jgi:hypothetical protein